MMSKCDCFFFFVKFHSSFSLEHRLTGTSILICYHCSLVHLVATQMHLTAEIHPLLKLLQYYVSTQKHWATITWHVIVALRLLFQSLRAFKCISSSTLSHICKYASRTLLICFWLWKQEWEKIKRSYMVRGIQILSLQLLFSEWLCKARWKKAFVVFPVRGQNVSQTSSAVEMCASSAKTEHIFL